MLGLSNLNAVQTSRESNLAVWKINLVFTVGLICPNKSVSLCKIARCPETGLYLHAKSFWSRAKSFWPRAKLFRSRAKSFESRESSHDPVCFLARKQNTVIEFRLVQKQFRLGLSDSSHGLYRFLARNHASALSNLVCFSWTASWTLPFAAFICCSLSVNSPE